jgi:peroxidase
MTIGTVMAKECQISYRNAAVANSLVILVSQEGDLWDNSFTPAVQDHLFESGNGGGGLDLVALNIQRGRDHGLPGKTLILI